ncbi:MAG TPA: chorismate mutase [Anaerolineales bacterium]|nr:chorismate mutase [Anaerolineales bacterium]
MTVVRGVRGAITVTSNSREEILTSTGILLKTMIWANDIRSEDVASAFFTVTPDLNAEFPALVARALGWSNVPLLCAYELSVPNSLPLCIRILLHWNTTRAQTEVQHVYLRDAERLRPDLKANWGIVPMDVLNHEVEMAMQSIKKLKG